MSTSQGAPVGGESAQLHRRALGAPELVFFIVAASAPLTAVAGGQAVSYLVTGNPGIPFLFLVVAAVLLLFTAGYAAMSRHVANAGAFYSYVTRGLGRIPGVGTAFVALVSYNAMQLGIYGLFGVAFGAFMGGQLGIDLPWWAWCALGWAVIAVLGVLQVDLNAKVLAVLLALEVLVVVLFDLAVLAEPGPEGFSGVGFSPSVALGGGAVGAALSFNMASYVGFESSAIYSEECREPRRTVARATYVAVIFITVLYALSSWLLAVAAGPSTITDPAALVEAGFTTPDGQAPDPTVVLFATGAERLGSLWGQVAGLLFATSLFAALLSFHNAVARYAFALGREGVLPQRFGRIQDRTGAPYVGSLAQSALALVVVGAFALAGQDPVLTLFTWLTNLGALGVFGLLALTSFAVVAFFRANPQLHEGRYATQVAPALAGVLLSVLFVVVLLNFNVLITGDPTAPLSSLAVILPGIVVGGGVLGLGVGAFMRARRPEAFRRIGEGARAEALDGPSGSF